MEKALKIQYFYGFQCPFLHCPFKKLIAQIEIYKQPYRFSLARHISFSASPISPSTPIDFPAIAEGI